MTQAADAGPGTGPGAGLGGALSRRDRLRAATRDEIIQTARRLLVRDGPESVSLRAIAREIGMTAPGLYRYFGSHEELLRHVIASLFTELSADIHQAIRDASDAFEASVSRDGAVATAGEPGLLDDGTTPEQHAIRLGVKMTAACREFRRWALNHPGEFGLIFGAPLPAFHQSKTDIAHECALRLAGTFFTLFVEMWNDLRFPVPSPEEIDAGLRDQLTRYREELGVDLPLGAMETFLRCWVLLYGAVAMEVFGHLSFALEDATPMFEITLREMAVLVGIRDPEL